LAFIIRIYHDAQSSECQIRNTVTCLSLRRANVDSVHHVWCYPHNNDIFTFEIFCWRTNRKSQCKWNRTPPPYI